MGRQSRAKQGESRRSSRLLNPFCFNFPPSHTAARVQTDAVISILMHFRGPFPNCSGNQKSRVYLQLSPYSYILFQFQRSLKKCLCTCVFCAHMCVMNACVCTCLSMCAYVYTCILHVNIPSHIHVCACVHLNVKCMYTPASVHVQGHFSHMCLFCMFLSKCDFISYHSRGRGRA